MDIAASFQDFMAVKFPAPSLSVPTGISRAFTVMASACLCMMWTSTLTASTDGSVIPAPAVRAAYLYRFTAYIEWPDIHSRTFTIAVLRDDEVADSLSTMLLDRSIKNLPLQVRKIKQVKELDDAQMLYIGSGFTGDLRKTIEAINHKPVLIVSSRPNALDAGSAINFIEIDNRIRFETSIAAVERSGLKIAPELLSVAARVQSNRTQRENNCQITTTSEVLNTRCNPGGAQ